MLTRWNNGYRELDEVFSTMNHLTAYLDRVFDQTFFGPVSNAARGYRTHSRTWPRTSLKDTGSTLVLTAEVPGLSEKDIQLTLNQGIVTLAGERKVQPPEGYKTHRQERAAVSFSRTYELPCPINAEHTAATVKDGVLTVVFEKAADAMPRQIAVKAIQ